jgi:hypothetical protein
VKAFSFTEPPLERIIELKYLNRDPGGRP